MIGLLSTAMDKFGEELYDRVEAAGLKDIARDTGACSATSSPMGRDSPNSLSGRA